MMYREFWETHFPDEYKCMRLAEKLCDIVIMHDPIKLGIEHMIAVQKADRFSGFSSSDPSAPAWRDINNPDYAYTDWWHYRITTCLHFKPTDNYMTTEGWPLGTECWYTTVELGWRIHTCSETPEMAIYRALILSHVALKHRAMHPKKRPHLEDMMADVSRANGLSSAPTPQVSSGQPVRSDHGMRAPPSDEQGP